MSFDDDQDDIVEMAREIARLNGEVGQLKIQANCLYMRSHGLSCDKCGWTEEQSNAARLASIEAQKDKPQ